MVRVSGTKASTCLVMTKTVGSVPRSVKTWTNTHKQLSKTEFWNLNQVRSPISSL